MSVHTCDLCHFVFKIENLENVIMVYIVFLDLLLFSIDVKNSVVVDHSYSSFSFMYKYMICYSWFRLYLLI